MPLTFDIIWTDYFKYKAELRGFSLPEIETIIRFSTERYTDILTGRKIVVGRKRKKRLLIAYEIERASIIPITVHATSAQQIKFRIQTGRFIHE